MKNIKNFVVSFGLLLGIGAVAFIPATTASAAITCPKDVTNCIQEGVDDVGGKGAKGLPALLKNVINLLLFIAGVIGVIMIIIGGIRYTLSGGDQSQLTSAKNTILYAVIGVVVAILSYAIVNFVVDKLV